MIPTGFLNLDSYGSTAAWLAFVVISEMLLIETMDFCYSVQISCLSKVELSSLL